MSNENPIVLTAEEVQELTGGGVLVKRSEIEFPLHRRWETQDFVHQVTLSVTRDGVGDWISSEWNIMTEEETKLCYPNGGGFPCPYGRVGDQLWVQEEWRVLEGVFVPSVEFRDEESFAMKPEDMTELLPDWQANKEWRSAECMPDWVARLVVRLIDVKAERSDAGRWEWVASFALVEDAR